MSGIRASFPASTSDGRLPVFRITKQTDYGILILTSLVQGSMSLTAADRDETESTRLLSAPEIAAVTGLSLPNVSKILKALVRGGVLESLRGVQGGYRLLRDPHWITIQEIIEALDGPISLTQCADAGPDECDVGNFCPMSANWRYINDRVRETLEGITLAQISVPGGVLAMVAGQESEDPMEERDV
ncbi:MAG: SUF system Fe-S cluster assembly regulator [Planctomycetota bacterium]|nr:MAG: SUF system Fe-S cluster assembly regulator [Planctomycetota bacterium]